VDDSALNKDQKDILKRLLQIAEQKLKAAKASLNEALTRCKRAKEKIDAGIPKLNDALKIDASDKKARSRAILGAEAGRIEANRLLEDVKKLETEAAAAIIEAAGILEAVKERLVQK
jgi:hypothetical protein